MPRSGTGIYYGWFVLAAAAMLEMLAFGAAAYGAGLFVLPLQAEFHISRADASSPVLILFGGAALVSPLVGRALDHFPIRAFAIGGALLFGLCFLGIAATSSLAVMALLLVLPGAAGFIALGSLTSATLATRWFFRRRGLALGLAAIATSGGGFIVVPLLARAIALYGWRTALVGETVLIAVIVILLALLVLKDRPASIGLADHPEVAAAPPPQAQARRHLSWRAILSRRGFWIPAIALASVSGTAQALVVTLVPYGVQLGFGAASSALLISGFSIAAAATKIVAGLLLDRIRPIYLLMAAAALMTAAMLLFTLPGAYPLLLAATILSGVALGCVLPTSSALLAAAFGTDGFGAVMGWSYMLLLFSAVLAVRFAGTVYDRTGGYGLSFAAFGGIAALVLAATAFLPLRRAA